jgi:hypothetical protein
MPEDRTSIVSLNQQRYSQRDFIKLIGLSASKVRSELLCNAHGKTCDSQRAQCVCQHRRIDSPHQE